MFELGYLDGGLWFGVLLARYERKVGLRMLGGVAIDD